jgi:hypothetical protein
VNAQLVAERRRDDRADRVRRRGGGRKPLTVKDATLLDDLRSLVEPSTRGDPQAPLLWTAKSLRNLAAGLRELGHQISHGVVGELLRALGYSLQANRKTREGGNHPDRDAQFAYINEHWRQASRRFRWIPRRRSWLAISRMPAASGDPKAHRSRCECTISSSSNSAAP